MPLLHKSDERIKELYPNNLELQQVVLVHRHGARTPVHKDLSNILYQGLWHQCSMKPMLEAFQQLQNVNEAHSMEHPAHERPPTFNRIAFAADLVDSWTSKQVNGVPSTGKECFYGQLTDGGKRMMQKLGTRLRDLYVDKLHVLPAVLQDSKLYLRSTDYSRTIESLQYLLHGLYPSQFRDGYGLKIHVFPDKNETMFPHNACASLAVQTKQFREAFRTSNAQRLSQTLSQFPLLDKALDSLPMMNRIFRIYDLLKCMHGNEIELPKGYNKSHIDLLEQVVVDQWARVYDSGEEVSRKAIGRFVAEMAAPIQDAVAGKPDAPKLAVFSGHDSTIVPLLCAFKAFDGSYPDFASIVSFELFKSKSFFDRSFYVRMSYNGEPVAIPACQAPDSHLKGDKTICSIDAFMKEVNRIVPQNYEADCASNETVAPDWD